MNYFKKRHRLKLLLILLAGLLLTFASAAYAIDPPHDVLSNCNSCHNADGLNRTSGGNIDNTPQNLICDECHNPSSNMPKVTHSSKETKTAGKSYIWNATWSYECRGCHNPHLQDQIRMHQDTIANGGAWIETGLIAQVTDTAANPGVYNVIVAQGDPGWFTISDPEGYPQLEGFIVQPDTNLPFYYRIVDNTSNTLTVSKPVETAFIGADDQFGISYGKMIKTEINSQRPIQSPMGKMYNSPGYSKVTPWRQIVYLLNSGMYSQSPPGAATDPQTKAICVVCHTRTKYNNVGYAVANGPSYQETFDTTINTDYFDHTSSNKHLQINYTSGATSCWDPSLDGCHKPPEAGFDAGATCGDCHGDSMSSSSDLVVQIKNTGTYAPVNTGNSVVGGHPAHGAFSCGTCHQTGMLQPDDSDNQIGNFTIDLSFNIPGTGHNGGTYDGRWPTDMVSSLTGSFLGLQYSYDGNNVGTQNGNMQCNNVYCHAGIVNGTAPAPQWDDTSGNPAQCGACHKADSGNPSDLGKHEMHIGEGNSSAMDALACTTCHPHNGGGDTAHVNGNVNWTFPSYGSALYRSANPGFQTSVTTGNNYGTCENLYCHSNGARGIGGASITYTNRSWNATEGSMGCNGCHADKNTGSPNWSFPHTEHNQEYGRFSCTDCHNSVVSDNSTVIANSLHLNGSAQVVFNSAYDGGGIQYSGTTCSNVKCHSTGVRADTADEYFQPVSWNFGSEQDCTLCHKFTNSAAAMKTGANVMSNTHIIHVASDTVNGNYNINCSVCHNLTTTDGSTIATYSVHADGQKDVSFSGVAAGGVYNNPTDYDCNNVYCHSEGKASGNTFAVASWTDANSGACGTCHARINTDIVNASGKHAKHAQGGASDYSFACSNCHQGIVSATTSSAAEPTISDVTQHVNGSQDVSFAVSSDPYGTPTVDDCSNNYCHSNGLPGTRGWTGANDNATTVDWITGGTVGCDSCHSKQGDSSATWSPTHEAHIGTGGSYSSRFDCSACHNDTATDASTINIKSVHVNQTVDVVFDSTYTSGTGTFDDSGGVGNDSCNNVKCHGTANGEFATPSWDDTITDCAACHRVAENQAAMDTGARQLSQAHVKHVALDNHGASDRDSSNYAYLGTYNRIQCDNCHNATTTDNSSISNYNNHIDFANEISFNITTDWPAGTVTPTWSGSATKTCENVYCHSDGDANDATRIYKTVTWSEAPWSGTGCDKCHGTPPPNGDSPNHSVGDTNCNSCHPHANTDIPSTGFVTGLEYKHLNGFVDQEGGCTNCHGQPPASTITLVNASYSGGISQRGEDYSQGWGAHVRHAGSVGAGNKGYACGTCHNGGQPTGGSHKDSIINIGFVVNSVSEGHYTYPAFTNTSFSITMGGSTTNTVTGTSGNPNTRICDNIYCHSDGGDYDNTPINYAQADWDEGTSLNCDACHGDGNNDGSGLLAQTERHVAHVNSTTYDFKCFECHNDTVNPDNSIKTDSLHVNYIKDVAFGNLGSDGNGYYTGPTRPDCTNTYCHSRGDANTGTGATAPYNTASWNETGFPSGTCDGCHGGNVSSTDKIVSGAHSYHTNNAGIIGDDFECAECHLDTLDTGSDTAIGTGKYGNHVNKLVNIRFGTLNPSGYYATQASPMSITPGSGPYNCENVYCHSDGNSGGLLYNTVAWNDTFAGSVCDDCHGVKDTSSWPAYSSAAAGQPGANSHLKHVTSPNDIGCQECHYNTTRDGTTIFATGYHLDGNSNVNNQDVAFNPSNANAAGGTYTPTTGDKSCDSTYCHGTSSTLSWGGSTDCQTCHGGGTSPLSLPAKHGVHYTNGLARSEDFTNPVNFSDSGNYNYSCKVCHYNVVHVGGQVVTDVQAAQVDFDATVAGGGTYNANTTSAGTDNGLSYTAGTGCDSTYCHSNALGSAGAVDPNWQTSTLDCGGCHSATGGSAAHSTHTTGNYTANANVSSCDSCHTQTVLDNTTIENKNYHVNVSNDVTWSSFVDPAGGTTTGYTQGTGCNNTYCHSDGTSSDPSHGNQAWSGSLDCTGCHSTGTLTSVHAGHINNENQVGFLAGCTECHNATASDNTTIANYTLHVNKAVNVKFDSTRNPDSYGPFYNGLTATVADGATKQPGAVAGTGCQNVYCHSDGNSDESSRIYNAITWSGTLSGCDDCHGVKDTSSWPAYASNTAGYPGANSHQKHVTAPNNLGCQECHWNTTQADATVVSGGRHLDGNSNINNQDVAFNPSNANATGGTYTPTAGDKSCDNTYCHGGSSTLSWGGSTDCQTCHGGGTSAPSLPGSHDVHYTNGLARTDDFANPVNFSDSGNYNYSCNICHSGVTHVGGVAATNQAGEVSFDAGYGSGSYVANTSASEGTDNGLSWTAGNNCNNTYCHSNALGGNGASDPRWGQTTSLDCGGCHSATGGSTPHDIHTVTYYAGGSGNTDVSDCNACHALTASDRTTVGDKSYHVNLTNNVSFNAFANASAGYTSGIGCDNTYCHSNGTSLTTPSHGAQPWSGTMTCDKCHGASTAAGSAIATGAHTTHINDSDNEVGYNIACAECHAVTAADNSSVGSNYPRHVNQAVNIQFSGVSNNNDTPYYDGSTTTGADGYAETVGDGASDTCQNVYCHSDGNTNNSAITWFKSVAWNDTVDCADCHGDNSLKAYPVYPTTGAAVANANSHVPHLEGGHGYTCNDCHNQTSTSGTSITGANHLNRQEDVDLAGAATYDSGTGRCSTTTCHGGLSIQWGDSNANGYDYCTICHGNPTTAGDGLALEYKRAPGADGTGVDTNQQSGTNDPDVGMHDRHLRAWSGSTSNKFSDDLACTNCHTVTALNTSNHMNGSVDFTWSPLATNGTSGPRVLTPNFDGSYNCNNTYCHGAAMPFGSNVNGTNAGADTSPLWTNDSYIDTTSSYDTACGQCHGFPPQGYDGDGTHNTMTIGDGSGCSGCHEHFEPGGGAGEPNWISLGSPFASATNAALHINRIVEAASCTGCHMTTGDTPTTVNQSPADATAALHDETEWNNSAHATAGLNCDNCHGGPHNPSDSTNPWRLLYVTANTPAVTELNNACLECHATTASNPNAASVGNRVDSWHYGTLHAAGNSGGQFCFDCHDPHGDGNMFLIQKNLSKTSNPTWGYATNATADPYFVNNGLAPDVAGSYVVNTSDAGLCQLCHDTTKYFNGTPLGTDYGRGHKATYGSTVCTSCHSHNDGTSPYNDAFAASGDCDTCHGYPPVPGDGHDSVYTGDTQYNGGKGKHYKHDFSAHLPALNATDDEYGNESTGYAQCATCHNAGTHKDDHLDVNGVTIKPEYSFDGVNDPAYIGVVNDESKPKNCFNVLCHFTRTPRWSEPGTGSLNNE